MPEDKNFKDQVFKSLFGGPGSVTMAQFRTALKAVVDHVLRFEQTTTARINTLVAGKNGKDGAPGINGQDGRNGASGVDGVDGRDGLPGTDGKDGSPDTGEQIVEKINKDKSGKVIKKEHVEGLSNIEGLARTADANVRSFMNTGSYVYDYDLSSLLDGVTKTFTLPQNARVIAVFSSSTPGVFRKNVDFTTTASAITFTSQIDAGSTLAQGQTLVLLYKIL